MLERHWFALLLVHAFLLQALVLLLRIAVTYEAVSNGLDAFWIGLIGGAFGVVPALVGLHLGRSIDRLGERRALIVGSAVLLLATFCLRALPATLGVLLAANVAMGLGQFLAVAAQHSAVGATDVRERTANFGHMATAIAVAHGAGPVAFGLFAQGRLIPDTASIFFTGALGTLLLLVLALCVRPPPHVPQLPPFGVWRTAGTLLATKGYWLAAFASLVVFAAMDLLVIYLPLYGAERGIGATTIGTLLAIRALASIMSRLFFGRLTRLMGRNMLLVTSLLLSSLSIGLLLTAGSPLVMGGLLFAAGFGLGVGAPITLAWISDIAPTGMRGSALSLRLALNRAGQAALPVAVGTMTAGVGAVGVIAATSLTLLAAGAISAYFAADSADG